MKVQVAFDYTEADGALLLVPGRNLTTGVKDFSAEHGSPTSLEEDLLLLASSVYASDVAVKRGQRLSISRDFRLTLPLVNHHLFERLRPEIELCLSLLSDDNWDLCFVPRAGEQNARPGHLGGVGKTLLFSGGLDSFAAAVDYLDNKENIHLVSHVTSSSAVRVPQEELHNYLVSKYGTLARTALRIVGKPNDEVPFPADHEREPTQRTRSFLFLSIAGLVARRSGFSEVVLIGENGQMAIHLPLSAARQGAFSTHTADPEFLSRMQGILSTLLDFPITITNPYLYKTKAEVISNVAKQHVGAVAKTISCWKAARVFGDATHCGECVPCLVRRIACEHNGLDVRSEYASDILAQPYSGLPDAEGRRNLQELVEFATRFERASSSAELESPFPELVSDHFSQDDAVSMYKRFAAEALTVLRRYPGLLDLLK